MLFTWQTSRWHVPIVEDIWLRPNTWDSLSLVTAAHGVFGFGLSAPTHGRRVWSQTASADKWMLDRAVWSQLLWVKKPASPADTHLYPETAWPFDSVEKTGPSSSSTNSHLFVAAEGAVGTSQSAAGTSMCLVSPAARGISDSLAGSVGGDKANPCRRLVPW